MKYSIYISLIFILSFARLTNSQVTFFDSINTLASNPAYDYKNPTFQHSVQYSWPYLPNLTKLAYERWNAGNSSCDIILREISMSGISPEVIIAMDAYKNINPVITDSFIVFQSIRSGISNICFSVKQSTGWSSPSPVTNSAVNAINPDIFQHKINPHRMYLVYEKNGDIFFKRYVNNIWLADSNITSDITEPCSLPKINIINNDFSPNRIFITFLKQIPDSVKRIVLLPINVNDTVLSFQNKVEYPQIKTVNNLRFSKNDFGLNYDYDTLGAINCVYLDLYYFPSLQRNVVTKNISNDNFSGIGTSVHTAIPNNYNLSMTGFYAWQRKRVDSTFIYGSGYTYSGLTSIKFIQLGSSAYTTKLDMSFQIDQNWIDHKYYLAWEKILSGKSAIYLSFSRVIFDGIKKISESINGFSLSQNYPNPFNPTSVISFQLPVVGQVSLKVIDMLGRDIETLVNEKLAPGTYTVDWNASQYSSGVYFYRLQTEGYTETKKMLLTK